MANSPFEIVVAPFEVYITTGTDAVPSIGSTPGGGWTLFGTNGKNNQAEGGVEITHTQGMDYVRVEGRTGPAKAFRTSEDQSVRFTLYDLAVDTYKHALSGDASAIEGTTGRSIGLSRSESVREVKLLIKGPSPQANNRDAMFFIPRAVHSGSPTVKFSKTGPSGLSFEFMTLEDLSAANTGSRFGLLYVGTAN